MKNTNGKSRQKAFDYALFMISSSYFDKQPKCINPYMEKKLYLYYIEAGYKQQIEMEKACICYMEQRLIPELPADIWDTIRLEDGKEPSCGKVHMIYVPEYDATEMQYETDCYILRLIGKYKGGKSKIKFAHQFFDKRIGKVC